MRKTAGLFSAQEKKSTRSQWSLFSCHELAFSHLPPAMEQAFRVIRDRVEVMMFHPTTHVFLGEDLFTTLQWSKGMVVKIYNDL